MKKWVSRVKDRLIERWIPLSILTFLVGLNVQFIGSPSELWNMVAVGWCLACAYFVVLK